MKMWVYKILCASSLIGIVSCGNATMFKTGDYDGRSAIDELSGDMLVNSRNKNSTHDLHWDFPCEADGFNSEGVYDFVGEGTRYAQMKDVSTFELTISGKLCAHQRLPRDIVFVIDVSASMYYSDPDASGSIGYYDPFDTDDACQRLRAMNKMVAYLAEFDDARVGLITYSSHASKWQPQLLPIQEFSALYHDNRYQMREMLCYAGGSTNYRGALLATEELLSSARENSFKEVYFFSDGKPDRVTNSKTNPAGIKEARRIRKTATIATVGLGSTGILKKKIASKVDGEPLHRQAENIDELFPLLQDLIGTENVGADLIYGYLGTETNYHVNIWEEAEFQDEESFRLAPIVLQVDPDDEEKDEGIRINITYKDSNGNAYEAHSELRYVFDQ